MRREQYCAHWKGILQFARRRMSDVQARRSSRSPKVIAPLHDLDARMRCAARGRMAVSWWSARSAMNSRRSSKFMRFWPRAGTLWRITLLCVAGDRTVEKPHLCIISANSISLCCSCMVTEWVSLTTQVSTCASFPSTPYVSFSNSSRRIRSCTACWSKR